MPARSVAAGELKRWCKAASIVLDKGQHPGLSTIQLFNAADSDATGFGMQHQIAHCFLKNAQQMQRIGRIEPFDQLAIIYGPATGNAGVFEIGLDAVAKIAQQGHDIALHGF